mgnify:CR=1 FL=1
MHRAKRHAMLALAAVVMGYLVTTAIDSKDVLFNISMATAYVSLLLLAISLSIGPWNLLRGNPNPVSSYLRRDIGIWAGITALIHVIAGLQVHMGGKFWLYFVYPLEQARRIPVRFDLFGLTNHAGLIVTLIMLLLLAISNNRSLRSLGAARWKYMQRWNYAVAILTVLHGVAYQILEKRELGFVILLGGVAIIRSLVQFVGFRRFRNRARV